VRASPRISRICLSAVPATETYKNIGGFDARGLEVAAVVTTEFVERGRAPCFGKATSDDENVSVLGVSHMGTWVDVPVRFFSHVTLSKGPAPVVMRPARLGTQGVLRRGMSVSR